MTSKQRRVRYLDIAEDIKRRVIAGELQPGHLLPPVRALAAHYQTGGGVIQTAIRSLSDQGWVRTQPRVGVLITDPPPDVPTATLAELTAKVAALEEYVRRHGTST